MAEDVRKRQAFELFREAYQQQIKGEFDTSVELYKQSIAVFPTAEAHTFLGWTYSFMGRLGDAIEECRRAIEVDPAFGNPYNDIGAYLMQQGQVDEAIPWLRRALDASRYESYCYPYMNLGRAYEQKRMWLWALEQYKKSVLERSAYAPALQGIARIRGLLN